MTTLPSTLLVSGLSAALRAQLSELAPHCRLVDHAESAVIHIAGPEGPLPPAGHAVSIAIGDPERCLQAMAMGYSWACSAEALSTQDLINAAVILERGPTAVATERTSRLIRGLNHELNNIWSSVMGQSQLLSMGSHSDEQITKRSERLMAAAETGNALTTALSRMVRQPPGPICHPWDDLLPSQRDTLTLLATPDTWPLLGCSAQRWQELVTHLLSNAATHGGGGDATLSSAHGSILLTVASALPSEHTPQLARLPYVSSTARTGDSNQLTGLGLAVADTIAVEAGGNMTITCTASGDWRVMVTLPGWAPAPQQQRHALIIDSNAELGEIIELAITDLGYAVTLVTTAASIDTCAHEWNVVIAEHQPPSDLPGIGAQTRILVTGSAPPIAGGQHLPRPFSLDGLKKALRIT